jgi:hypothetical protein
LNKLVELDGYQLPKISELISSLHSKRFFMLIDLKDGFYHIPLIDEDRGKKFFSTGTRLMKFRYIPQSFKNSPAVFQRAMTIVLKDLLEIKCLCYIDDILVLGESELEHDENLCDVIERLNQYNLKENKENV